MCAVRCARMRGIVWERPSSELGHFSTTSRSQGPRRCEWNLHRAFGLEAILSRAVTLWMGGWIDGRWPCKRLATIGAGNLLTSKLQIAFRNRDSCRHAHHQVDRIRSRKRLSMGERSTGILSRCPRGWRERPLLSGLTGKQRDFDQSGLAESTRAVVVVVCVQSDRGLCSMSCPH